MGIERTIDITPVQQQIILKLLDRHLPDTTAWVYGSRAKWTSRPQSDLDLVVAHVVAPKEEAVEAEEGAEPGLAEEEEPEVIRKGRGEAEEGSEG